MAHLAFTRFEEPVHLLVGDSAGGTVRTGRRRCEFVCANECLAIGPCDVDPARHGRMRREFWQQWSLGWDRRWGRRRKKVDPDPPVGLEEAGVFTARLAAYPETRPLLFWTTEAWRESLWFWWALDAVERAGIPRERFWVARPAVEGRPEYGLGCIPPAECDGAFTRRQPLGAGLLAAGAALWRKVAGPSPDEFDAARRGGVPEVPQLQRLGEGHSWFFPRVDRADGRLRLSRFDQGLLDRMDGQDWRTPYAALIRSRDFLDDYLDLVGDMLWIDRLDQWAGRAGEPALHSRKEDGEGWNSFSYRLTPLGERIRREGLQHAEEAPPMFVGGCQVYTGDEPWVRRQEGESWRLVRHRGPQ